MTFSIGIDVGGTFTDYVAFRGGGEVVSGKTPSTPGRESDAVLDAVRRIAGAFALSTRDLLAGTDVINFGTTVATNAMLEHKGARVGMVTTKGFRDIVDLRRGYKESLTDIRLQAPPPIARRGHRIGVTERIGPDGEVLVPLDEAEVRAAVARLSAAGVRSFAVCLLQARANPAHERRCGELIAEAEPDAHVSLSTNVLNQIGEFERFSTTLVNAYLSPVLGDYMVHLLDELRASGFGGQLLVMQSNGGTGAAPDMGRNGARALLSGPAGGVVAASAIGTAAGHPNVIGVDMGGTSYDLSLVRGGRPGLRTDAWAARYRIGLSILDIHTIGAGGGSIAWIDPGRALRVGPQSAGATPGPACYGRGGDRPTVTDADLVLGYLSAENFIGGEMSLHRAPAEEAIARHVAEPLGVSLVDAAVGITRIVDNNMSNGIRYISVARGHDPRDFALLAFGGAAATHAPVQARDLGIRTILVPRAAGVLSAYGTLLSDLRVSTSAPWLGLAADTDVDALGAVVARLRDEHEGLVRAGAVEAVEHSLSADFRYAGQVHELTIPVATGGGPVTRAAWEGAVAAFHDMHEQLYTFRLTHKPVEVITVRLDLVGVRPKPEWRRESRSGSGGAPRPRTERVAWLPDEAGRYAPCPTPVYEGAAIRPGQRVEGPAIIEEDNTTIVLHDGDRAVLDERGLYTIALPGARA